MIKACRSMLARGCLELQLDVLKLKFWGFNAYLRVT